ncbi:MAG TPA: DUF2059 domain-containing protein [Planctomycetota bacterium]|nr:DUF2059 domain-containing protein [Planctomycetota bacterium]
MKKSVLLAGVAALVLAGTIPLFAQSDAEAHKAKLDDIRKLLDLNGGAASARDVMQQMSTNMSRMMPQVPPEFWDEFMKEVNPQELIDLSVPVYDKYLEHDDVKALIAFYETPAGKKLASVQPKIGLECMQAGQQWGMAIGQRVAKKLQERDAREREERRQKMQKDREEKEQEKKPAEPKKEGY